MVWAVLRSAAAERVCSNPARADRDVADTVWVDRVDKEDKEDKAGRDTMAVR